MLNPGSPAQTTAGNDPAEASDAKSLLSHLRSTITGPVRPADLEGLLDSLSAAVEQIQAENAGMADELICLYEQIGVIFDVTRKLPDVQRETDILQLFLRSLRRSFDQRQVSLALPRDPRGRHKLPGDEPPGDWQLSEADIALTEWLKTVLEKTVRREKVALETPTPGAMPSSVAELMLAPIAAGNDTAAVLILARTDEAPAFRSGEMLLLESLTTFCGDLIRTHRLMDELRQMSVSMVRSLVNAVDQKDQYTSGHSLRVAYYATMLGQLVGLSLEDLRMLQWSALLHDVGKIGIRDDVLKKEGKLTDEEFAHIKEHPVRSFRVVEGIPQLAGACDGILHHHERFDGRGYPAGLAGEDIPLQARIIQVADIFDALTSNRSYRPAFTWEQALEIMDKDAGTVLDCNLEGKFAEAIRKELVGRPGAWEELTRRATAFRQMVAAPAESPMSPARSGTDSVEGGAA